MTKAFSLLQMEKTLITEMKLPTGKNERKGKRKGPWRRLLQKISRTVLLLPALLLQRMMPAALLLPMQARLRLSRKQMKIFSRCLRRKNSNPIHHH